MNEFLSNNKIKMYSTENEEKSSIVERWNRTMKNNMWKQFTVQGNTMYLEMLPKLLKEYNNTYHTSIKMSPIEASKKKNRFIVLNNLFGDESTKRKSNKFKIGDKVRISKYKRKTFDKGYTPNWTEEIFIVSKVKNTNPYTYEIKDLLDEDIKGSFYEKELQKAKQEVFRIEKVLKRKGNKAFVKWVGYNSKFNSWVDVKDTIALRH